MKKTHDTDAKARTPRGFGTKEWAQRNVVVEQDEETGTKEWAPNNINCVKGCSHNCYYCYGKAMAVRFKRKTAETWEQEEIAKIKAAGGKPRRFMFPSTHDITPKVLPVCIQQIRNILSNGHEILIVSKPHAECISATHLTASV
jgi:radical SAM superfamily enzyme YgiQ (UPF0313 family)